MGERNLDYLGTHERGRLKETPGSIELSIELMVDLYLREFIEAGKSELYIKPTKSWGDYEVLYSDGEKFNSSLPQPSRLIRALVFKFKVISDLDLTVETEQRGEVNVKYKGKNYPIEVCVKSGEYYDQKYQTAKITLRRLTDSLDKVA